MALLTQNFARRAVKFLMAFLSCYGGMWLLINSFTTLNFGKVPDNYQVWSYFVLLIASIVFGAWRSRPKKELTVNINGIKIKIFPGDLFSLAGQRVISVNEFFDSSIGRAVSNSSVHGQFILKILDGRSSAFDDLINAALGKINFTIVPEKDYQPNKRFDLGTTAFLQDIRGNDYYLVALAKTDLETAKAKATQEDYVRALNGLWKSVQEHSNGNIVNMPILGGGLSNVSQDLNTLIRLVLFSLSIQNEIPAKHINIILYDEQTKHVDFESIGLGWGPS